MYPLSDLSLTLPALKVDVDLTVVRAHPSMREEVRKACEIHNRAIDLMTGQGEFVSDWAAVPVTDTGVVLTFDPGVFGPLVDDLTNELKAHQSPYAIADFELVSDRVDRIKTIDANHPVAKNAEVLFQRCGK